MFQKIKQKLSNWRYQVAYQNTNEKVPNPLKNYPRNQLCYCDSGIKFKRCHLNLLPATVTPEVAQEIKELLKTKFNE